MLSDLRHPREIQRTDHPSAVRPHENEESRVLQEGVGGPGREDSGSDKQSPGPQEDCHGLQGKDTYLVYLNEGVENSWQK